jgi:hypothetical protein
VGKPYFRDFGEFFSLVWEVPLARWLLVVGEEKYSFWRNIYFLSLFFLGGDAEIFF